MRLYFLQFAIRPTSKTQVPGYLIKTRSLDGADVNILVDTGWPPSMVGKYQPGSLTGWLVTEDDLVMNRLAEIGLRPSDIGIVICTHLDPDHAGGNNQFPDAKFIVQRAQYEIATTSGNPRFGYPNAKWNDPNLRYTLVDGDADIAEGVRVIESSGHVIGHQSVLVRLPKSGPMLLAADAITLSSHTDADTRFVGPYDMDADLTRASTRKLMTLAGEVGATVIFGHDAAQWATLRKAPEFYE